jgi:hypothetical protein
MKKIIVTIALTFVLCLSGMAQQAAADTPATKADVEKYLQAMHSQDMMIQMVDAMSKPMKKMIHEQYLKQEDKLPSDFEARMGKMTDEMLRELPWDEILQAMVPAYQKHFTKGDMEALTTFYSSPTGQKVLREMPALMADSMEVMMPLIQEHVEKVGQRIQNEVVAMAKESSDSPAATPAQPPAATH